MITESAEDISVQLMDLALNIAKFSKDRSTKVGCLVVDEYNNIVTTGYNGFANGVNENVEARYERPDKYDWTVHAEINAIANAARLGHSLNGRTMYSTQVPCKLCMGPIIQAGITTIICPKPDKLAPKWSDSSLAEQMAKEAGVVIVWYV